MNCIETQKPTAEGIDYSKLDYMWLKEENFEIKKIKDIVSNLLFWWYMVHMNTDSGTKITEINLSAFVVLQINADNLTSVIFVHEALHWALYHVIPEQIWILLIQV